MSKHFSPDADDQMPEKKSSQQLLLLLLLLLVVLFAYLYFFTGLIKSREEQPKPQLISEAPIKKPLPPRAEQKGAEPAQPGTAKTEEHKAATPPVPPAQPPKPAAPAKEAAVVKPAPGAPGAKPVQPAAPTGQVKPGKPAAPAAPATPATPAAPQAKTAHPAAAPVKEAKTAHPAAAPVKEAKTAHPAAAPVKEVKSAHPAEKKPAVKAAEEARLAQKKAAGEKAAAAPTKKPKAAAKPAAPAYTLEINGDLVEGEMGPVMAKLKQAGITHVVKTKSHKGEPMHRLFLADFANRDVALEELERLKLATSDAFMLKENGRYAVYGGSYLREAKAVAEQERLQGQGVQLLLKSATAPVAILKVRAGNFADQSGADKAARALKKAGLSVKVVKVAKVGK